MGKTIDRDRKQEKKKKRRTKIQGEINETKTAIRDNLTAD